MRGLMLMVVFAVSVVSTANAQQPGLSDEAVYRRQGADGLVNTITVYRQGSTQTLEENHNLDLTPGLGCKLTINIQASVSVPAGYNQQDFLPRTFKSCTWTIVLDSLSKGQREQGFDG